MVQDTIQLGVKRPQGKSLSCAKLRGFFYGGAKAKWLWMPTGEATLERVIKSTRQHLILQAICAGRRREGIQWPLFLLLSRRMFGACRKDLVGWPYMGFGFLPPHTFFYDIPSSKRVARCTNILHTGATLSGVGEGQWLRKGFQGCAQDAYIKPGGQSNRMLIALRYRRHHNFYGMTVSGKPESLSSAAEIRHPARNTRLWDIDLCFACIHR